MEKIYGVSGSWSEKESYTRFSSITELIDWLEDNKGKVVYPFVTHKFNINEDPRALSIFKNYSPLNLYIGGGVYGVYFSDDTCISFEESTYSYRNIRDDLQLRQAHMGIGNYSGIPWSADWPKVKDFDKLSGQVRWEFLEYATRNFQLFLISQRDEVCYWPVIFDNFDRRALYDGEMFERMFQVPYEAFQNRFAEYFDERGFFCSGNSNGERNGKSHENNY